MSFSAMGLNSSGLRYRSLLVSREENRNSPSFPKDFRASSCFGNKRQVRFWWNLLHQSTLESIPIPASTSRGKIHTPWQDLVLFAMSRTAGTRTLNLHLPEQFQLNICSRSVSFARKIPIFSSQLVLNLQTLGAPGGGDCHELMCRETKAARHVRTTFQKHKGTELSPWNWNFHSWWDPQQHPHPPNLQPQNHMEYFGSQLPQPSMRESQKPQSSPEISTASLCLSFCLCRAPSGLSKVMPAAPEGLWMLPDISTPQSDGKGATWSRRLV